MMEDTVYRKDVIKALEDMSGGYSYIETTTLGAITTIRELPSAQPEITLEQVNEFCEERGFVVLTKEEYQWLKSLKSKAEEFRWNGGGNY